MERESSVIDLGCRGHTLALILKINRELSEVVIKLVLLARDSVTNAETLDTTDATPDREELEFKLNPRHTFQLTWDLRVAPAYDDVAQLLTLLVDGELESHVVLGEVV